MSVNSRLERVGLLGSSGFPSHRDGRVGTEEEKTDGRLVSGSSLFWFVPLSSRLVSTKRRTGGTGGRDGVSVSETDGSRRRRSPWNGRPRNPVPKRQPGPSRT